MSDRVTLTDYEARRLLNAIVKEFVQMTAEELEQQASEGNRYTHDFFLSPPPRHTHIFLPMQKTATERLRRVELIRLNGKMDGSFLGSHVELLRDSIAF